MSFKDQIDHLLDDLSKCLDEAHKFDSGNDAAGRRLRMQILDIRNEITTIRKNIQVVRNERKENVNNA